MTKYEQVNAQEKKDFIITNKIMAKIFQRYDAIATLTQMPRFTHYDATMEVTKGDFTKEYTVEIKERNVSNPEYMDTMPLKVKKYVNIINHSEDKTPLVIYLLNNEQYYIFDLTKLDLNKVKIANWKIPKVQYADTHEYEEQPTFFFPISMAVYNGKIN